MTDQASSEPGKPVARRFVDYALAQTKRVTKSASSPSAPFFDPAMVTGYEVGALIHQGGQGFVFRAVQRSTGKAVALKVLRNGVYSSETERTRLHREAHALAQLHHPNIVGISDSGIAAGHDYFVMEYVEGLPLDEYVRKSNAPLRDTLRLFATVCEAVYAAHRKGIIHRDLKPSNIRVTAEGDPRVLDFGMAKFTDSTAIAEAAPTITETGQFVGSLPWAAPEQARGEWDRVDARTDVYSLGVVLYRLLTGKFPYPVTGSLSQVVSAITEMEPARPRSRSNRLNDEVETIILTCLRKEPERRYEDAGAIARDLRRYLAGEPIDAKRDSGWYLLRKSLQRHRQVAAVLVLGIVGLSAYAIHVQYLLHRALEAEERQTRAAELSQSMLSDSIGALQFVVRQAAEELGQTTSPTEVRTQILNGAREWLVELSRQAGTDPRFQREEASIHSQLGSIAEAGGQYAEAHRQNLAALSLRKAVVEQFPDVLADQAQLSIALVRAGDSMNRLGMSDFEDFYAQALKLDEALAEAEPSNLWFLDNLLWSYDRTGTVQLKKGNLDQAEPLFQKQVAIADRLTQLEPANALRWYGLSSARRHLGDIVHRRGDRDAANDLYDEAELAGRKAIQLDPTRRDYQGYMSHFLMGKSQLAYDAGDQAMEQSSLEDVVAICRTLYESDSKDIRAQALLIDALRRLGDRAAENGDVASAKSRYQDAIRYGGSPDVGQFRGVALFRNLHDIQEKLAEIALQEGQTKFAEYHLRQAIAIIDSIAGHTGYPEDALRHVVCQHRMGQVLRKQGEILQAQSYDDRAAAVADSLLRSDNVSAAIVQSLEDLQLPMAGRESRNTEVDRNILDDFEP